MGKNRRRLLIAAAIGTALVGGGVGTCSLQANRFNGSASRIPCRSLRLPEVAGAKALTESLCVSVSGEQPGKIGVESKNLGNGRKAHTLFLEWNFDGITEFARKSGADAEPITIIVKNGKPVEIHTRSHWRVGEHDFTDCVQPSGKVVVVVANAFHTPVVAGCDPTVVDAKGEGGSSFVFDTVSDYARAVAQTELGRDGFKPLRETKENEVPGPDHQCRTQPLFSE
jgi:hypothetical protein